MAVCFKCKTLETDSYSHVKCNKCDSILCVKCSNISASEHKGIALGIAVRKRSPQITFLCKDCFQTRAEININDILQDLKNNLLKQFQKGFDEIKKIVLTNDQGSKLIKISETTLKSLDTYY